MKHFSEEELIAYQLGESEEANAVHKHVEACSACAMVSDSIAETLRVFSPEPVPEVDLERNWRRVRGNLTVLDAEPRRYNWLRLRWMWSAAGLAMAAALVLAVSLGVQVRQVSRRPNYAIHRHQPLTAQPVDPQIAEHLDAAERLLTEVNHASTPLDNTTKSQAQSLLLKNAVYVSTAHEHGDVAEAAVLENLGRVLTTISNEPSTGSSRSSRALRSRDETGPAEGVGFRLEMNTSGLLLEIRILRQNDDRKQ